jgi:hypothetical protein
MLPPFTLLLAKRVILGILPLLAVFNRDTNLGSWFARLPSTQPCPWPGGRRYPDASIPLTRDERPGWDGERQQGRRGTRYYAARRMTGKLTNSTVSFYRCSEDVLIKVRDNGSGISAELGAGPLDRRELGDEDRLGHENLSGPGRN